MLVLASAALAAAQDPSHDWAPESAFGEIELAGVESVSWATTFGSAQGDWVNELVALADGSFVAAGFVGRSTGGPPEWDAFAHKLDRNGRAVWTKRYGGPGLDAGWSVKAARNGRLALAGFSAHGGAGGTDSWLLLLDKNGEPFAEERYGGAGNDRATDVVLAGDGGLLLVGQTETEENGLDVWLVRTDPNGRERWRRGYGGARDDRGFYGVATRDGGFAVAGVTGEAGAYDVLILKVDAEGRETWRRTLGGEGNDPSHRIDEAPDGRLVVVGYTESYDAAENDLAAWTLSPDGDVLTGALLGGPGDDRVMRCLTVADGSTWLVGYTKSFGEGDWDVMLARLSAEGRFEPWMAAIGTAHDDHGTAVALAADGDGDSDLVVGGYTHAPRPPRGEAASDLLLFRLAPDSMRRRTDGVVARGLHP